MNAWVKFSDNSYTFDLSRTPLISEFRLNFTSRKTSSYRVFLIKNYIISFFRKHHFEIQFHVLHFLIFTHLENMCIFVIFVRFFFWRKHPKCFHCVSILGYLCFCDVFMFHYFSFCFGFFCVFVNINHKENDKKSAP